MIGRESLATYLTGVFRVPVDVRAIRRLGGEGQGEDPKGFGYGVPLEVECVVAGETRRLVVSRIQVVDGVTRTLTCMVIRR